MRRILWIAALLIIPVSGIRAQDAPALVAQVAASAGLEYVGLQCSVELRNVDPLALGCDQVQGYLLVKGLLQWPALNVKAESFADLSVYKAMSLLDTFPLGDPSVLAGFLNTAFPNSTVEENAEISEVFARNIVTYFNSTQQSLIPQ